jgi:hypothetical protein
MKDEENGPHIWTSNLVANTRVALVKYRTGFVNHARRTLPKNVLGTAPGNTRWSYFDRDMKNNSGTAQESGRAHVGVRLDRYRTSVHRVWHED